MVYDSKYPLYNPELEHESCGVGAVVDLSGKATHRTVDQSLTIVERLAHRAGSDALGTIGDGVGIMTQIPKMKSACPTSAGCSDSSQSLRASRF